MSHLPPTTELEWTDQYGTIAGEVYETAQHLWPHLERFAWQTLGDAQAGHQLLMKACALVTQIQAREPERITHLPRYLEVTWKRLIFDAVEKEKAHQKLHQEIASQSLPSSDAATQIEQVILIQELVARMDAWTRTVYEYQVLGHTFEEISQALGQSGHVIRTKFHKKMKKLMHQIAAESQP